MSHEQFLTQLRRIGKYFILLGVLAEIVVVSTFSWFEIDLANLCTILSLWAVLIMAGIAIYPDRS